jgi:hypothetical protein
MKEDEKRRRLVFECTYRGSFYPAPHPLLDLSVHLW